MNDRIKKLLNSLPTRRLDGEEIYRKDFQDIASKLTSYTFNEAELSLIEQEIKTRKESKFIGEN